MHKVLGFATEFEPSSSTLHVTLGKEVSFLGLMCCSRGDGDVITRLPSLLLPLWLPIESLCLTFCNTLSCEV